MPDRGAGDAVAGLQSSPQCNGSATRDFPDRGNYLQTTSCEQIRPIEHGRNGKAVFVRKLLVFIHISLPKAEILLNF